jgi:hypothetical protein
MGRRKLNDKLTTSFRYFMLKKCKEKLKATEYFESYIKKICLLHSVILALTQLPNTTHWSSSYHARFKGF